MKQLVMPDKLKSKSLKTLRFFIIGVAGRVVKHARQLALQLSGSEATIRLFWEIQANIQSIEAMYDSG